MGLITKDFKTLLASLISPKVKDPEEKKGPRNSPKAQQVVTKLEKQISLKCQLVM